MIRRTVSAVIDADDLRLIAQGVMVAALVLGVAVVAGAALGLALRVFWVTGGL